MSIKVSRAVWAHFREGGNLKLTLLALADWADDSGCKIYPAMTTIAAKVCCSDVQARRMVHMLIGRGIVDVVGNENGGAPGTTRQYRINLQRLTAIAGDTPTPLADDRGQGARGLSPVIGDGSHRRSETALASDSQSVIEPSVNRELLTLTDNPIKKQRRQRRRLPLTACPGELDVNEQMTKWAIAEGVPADRVIPETAKFLNRNAGNGTMQHDWIATWRNWMLKSVEFARERRA